MLVFYVVCLKDDSYVVLGDNRDLIVLVKLDINESNKKIVVIL